MTIVRESHLYLLVHLTCRWGHKEHCAVVHENKEVDERKRRRDCMVWWLGFIWGV